MAGVVPETDDVNKFFFGKWAIPVPQLFYESATCKGIVNVRPQLKGHVLCVSARREPKFANLDAGEVCDLFLSVQRIARAVSHSQPGTTALSFALQDGPAAGQTVPHIHVHVLPRKPLAGTPASTAASSPSTSSASERHFEASLANPAAFIHETAHTAAFPLVTPALPGHAVVVTKRCVSRFMDLTVDEVADLWLAAQEVGTKVLAATPGATACNYAIQDGPDAGQVCEHVHLHVIPRRDGDLLLDEIYEKLEIAEFLLGPTGAGEGAGEAGHVSKAVDPAALAAAAEKAKDGFAFKTLVPEVSTRYVPSTEEMYAEATKLRELLMQL